MNIPLGFNQYIQSREKFLDMLGGLRHRVGWVILTFVSPTTIIFGWLQERIVGHWAHVWCLVLAHYTDPETTTPPTFVLGSQHVTYAFLSFTRGSNFTCETTFDWYCCNYSSRRISHYYYVSSIIFLGSYKEFLIYI